MAYRYQIIAGRLLRNRILMECESRGIQFNLEGGLILDSWIFRHQEKQPLVDLGVEIEYFRLAVINSL